MSTTWLLAFILILALPPGGCRGTPAAMEPAQAPEPGEPTPAQPTPEPGEPVDPRELEEPTAEPGDPGIPTPDPRAPCCFSNPRYAGSCVVTPTADETCASILAYLNDQRSVGKSYCEHTDIRGGWELVQCTAE